METIASALATLVLIGVFVYANKVMYDGHKSYDAFIEAYRRAHRAPIFYVRLPDGTLQLAEEYAKENPQVLEQRTKETTKKDNK